MIVFSQSEINPQINHLVKYLVLVESLVQTLVTMPSFEELTT